MSTLLVGAEGPADAATAWERYADPDLWSSWAPQIQRVEASTARLEAGTTGTVHAGLLPRPTLPISFEVLAVDEGERTWSWRAGTGPLRLRLEHGVTSRGPGSATWVRIHGPLPVIVAYVPVMRLALRRLCR